jgi:hypothetical protein
MFRSTTIIRELAIEPGQSYVDIKTYITHMPYWDMLPHHCIINYDVNLLNVLITIQLRPGSSASSLMMVVDRNM